MIPAGVRRRGMATKKTAASGAPTSIHGLRRPIRERVRSDNAPTAG